MKQQNENAVLQHAGPQLPSNPFASERAKHINAGTVEIEASRAIAEAQGKLLIAKRFPRNPMTAFTSMMESCRRPSFAQQAMYSYPRGGQVVSGPSIRMAEELARNWGNIEFGTRELSRRDGESEMEAYAWDLETNLVRSIKFTVRHLRDKKGGSVQLTDERDIYEVTANMGGRRVRACLLAILPPDYVDAAVQECAKTVAGGNQEPLADRVKKMLAAFLKWNVSSSLIEQRIGKKLDAILPDDLVELVAIHNSIRDGQSKVADWFGTEAADTSALATAAPTVATVTKKTAKKQATPAPEEEPEKTEGNVSAQGEQNDDEDIL